MTYLQLINKPKGAVSLATALTAGATTLDIYSGQETNLPSNFNFLVTFEYEIILFTSAVGTTTNADGVAVYRYNVTRGQETSYGGVAATAHGKNTPGELRVTAGVIQEMQNAVTGSTTGWVADTNTWTYASSTTFTVTGNQTATFINGVKLRFKQGGSYKYVTVSSSAFGATTTVTVYGNDTIANSAITDNYYSYLQNPQSFNGAWTPYTSVLTGFSGSPTQSCVYDQYGKTVNAFLSITGTSNTTGFTLTLPVAAKSARVYTFPRCIDNGSYITGGILTTTAGSVTATINTSNAGGTWTAANNKGIEGPITYEAN